MLLPFWKFLNAVSLLPMGKKFKILTITSKALSNLDSGYLFSYIIYPLCHLFHQDPTSLTSLHLFKTEGVFCIRTFTHAASSLCQASMTSCQTLKTPSYPANVSEEFVLTILSGVMLDFSFISLITLGNYLFLDVIFYFLYSLFIWFS